MKKEPSNELGGLQSHDLFLLTISIITPEEGDLTVPECEDAFLGIGKYLVYRAC
jgi:hypothetical protein